MIRKFRLFTAALALAAGLTGMSAVAASAHVPVNHCPLWANSVLHPHYPHCYANL